MQTCGGATDQYTWQGQQIAPLGRMDTSANGGGGGFITCLHSTVDGTVIKAAIGITKMANTPHLRQLGLQVRLGFEDFTLLIGEVELAQIGMGQGVGANFLPRIDPGLHLRDVHQRNLGHTSLKVPLIILSRPMCHHIARGREAKPLKHGQRILKVVFVSTVL